MKSEWFDTLVIGAGPAGVVAALRAADLGARTALVSKEAFGGMAANDGPIPVRTLAHAARLLREARQLGRYGIQQSEPVLDYEALLARVNQVVEEVGSLSALRKQIDSLGVTVFEDFGVAQFVDKNTIKSETGIHLRAEKIIICGGGVSRRLSVPGFELTHTHSDAWSLQSAPKSMIIIGAGATGAQVASIFNAFGTKIQLYQAGPRILPTEDEDVSRAVAFAFTKAGIDIHENFGSIDSFEKTPTGIRMITSKDGKQNSTEAEIAVAAVGWVANTEGLNLDSAGVKLNSKGFVQVDEYLKTSSPNIFAAGDITGRLMLVPQAIQDGFIAATNAVLGLTLTVEKNVTPIGSFTDPEYAQVGLTEADAGKSYPVAVVTKNFDEITRSIIDGRTFGFCKLIVDRTTFKILGCHVVGDRAVEIAQIAAVAMSAGMRIDDFAHIPFSFPTYAGSLGLAAASLTRQLNHKEKKGEPDEYPISHWQNL